MSQLKFDTAVAIVQSLPASNAPGSVRIDDKDKLILYKNYKQVTIGDVNIPRPLHNHNHAQIKWDAWHSVKGRSTDEARWSYVRQLIKLLVVIKHETANQYLRKLVEVESQPQPQQPGPQPNQPLPQQPQPQPQQPQQPQPQPQQPQPQPQPPQPQPQPPQPQPQQPQQPQPQPPQGVQPSDNMPYTATAMILPNSDNPGSIYSKYFVESSYRENPTAPALRLRLNINADNAVRTFRSEGATDSPPRRRLTLKFDSVPDGFADIKGIIGGGQISITTTNGEGIATISGPIQGGPKGSQSFIGAGTWLLS